MKITHKIMALALMLAIGLSTASAASTTNDWFKVNFESGYAVNGLITNSSGQAGGTWTSTGGDASTMTNYTGKGNIGKLNTLGGSLVWTPTNATGNVVLLDAAVYMVGSDDAPATSAVDAQTEVFLTNVSASVSYLCAHVGDGGTGSKWVAITNALAPVGDKTWVNLRIEINYDATPNMISFYVDGYKMISGASDSFPVMYSGASQTKVNSVSFMGTGYLDNFIGRTIIAKFGVGVVNTNGSVVPGGTAASIVDASGTVTATFATGTEYVTIAGPNGYSRTVRTSDGIAAFNSSSLPPGTYSITAFYGNAPTLTTGMADPVAATISGNKAAEVIQVGQDKKISFTVAPKSGLYYTLFAGETLASLKAGAASVLALPGDETAGFIKLTMPVPTAANEVKIIKIYASDAEYEAGDPAPTQQ